MNTAYIIIVMDKQAVIFIDQHSSDLQQQIIQLRIQLAKYKQKAKLYDLQLNQTDQYKNTLNQLNDMHKALEQALKELARTMGVGMYARSQLTPRSNIKQSQSIQDYTRKIEEINNQCEKHLMLIKRLTQAYGLVRKSQEDMQVRYSALDSANQSIQAQNNKYLQQVQRIKQLQSILKTKDHRIAQLQQTKIHLQSKIKTGQQKTVRQAAISQSLQQKLQEKTRQIEEIEERLDKSQGLKIQQQEIQAKCNQLIQMFDVPQNAFLKHFLQSSGLDTEVQSRNRRNKYSLVFDS